MKRAWLWGLVAVIGCTPSLAGVEIRTGKQRDLAIGGMHFIGGDHWILHDSESTPGDVFVGAGKIDVGGTVHGDLSAVAGDISVNGTVDGDAQLAGSSVTVTGKVHDDLRSFAARTLLDGEVTGDVVLSGAEAELGSGSHVSGSVAVWSAKSDLSGTIDGPVMVKAGRVMINGTINGNVNVVCDELIVGQGAKIAGDLTYTARERAEIEPGVVAGAVNKVEEAENVASAVDERNAEKGKTSLGLFLFKHLYWPGVSLVAGVLLVLFLGRFVNASLQHAATSSGLGLSLGLGMMATFVLLVMSVACCFLLPMALASLSAMGAIYYFGGVLGKMIAGQWMLRPLLKRQAHPMLGLLIGLIVLELLGAIPYLGALISLAATMSGIGALLIQLRSAKQGDSVEGMPQM